MIKALALFRQNRNVTRNQELKDRILKNRAGVLDAIAENIEGARQCPLLLGQKCIGGLCELFQKYDEIGQDGKVVKSYSKCNFNMIPQTNIENTIVLRNVLKELQNTQKLMCDLVNIMKGDKNADNA